VAQDSDEGVVKDKRLATAPLYPVMAATLDALDGVDGPTAVSGTLAAVEALAAAAGLSASVARADGKRHLLWRLAASRPAFGAGHRQALLISASLDGDLPHEPDLEAEPPPARGRALARGGLLAAYGVAALLEIDRLIGQGLATGRDLVLSIEHRAEGPNTPDGEATDARAVLADCAVAVAEAGGYTSLFHGARIAPVAVAQKGSLRLRLLAEGERPAEALIGALARVSGHAFSLRPTDASRAFLQGVAEVLGGLGSNLAARGLLGAATHAGVARRLAPGDRALAHELLHDTVAVTRLRAGDAAQGRPRRAEALLDCRLVPGRPAADWTDELRALVGDGIQVSVLHEQAGTVAPLHGPMLHLLCEALEAADPTLRAVPTMQINPGDALGWRQNDIPCYGFTPVQLAPEVGFGACWRTGRLQLPDTAWQAGAEVFVQTVARLLVEG
jgi:hypothetical protein